MTGFSILGGTAARHDRMQSYVTQMLPCFNRLQESAARLAGLLVEAELMGNKAALDGGSRELGLKALREAADILDASGSVVEHAHFQHHLRLARERLQTAWTSYEARRQGVLVIHDPLPALQAAWREMQAASRILPGFETVDFRNACCAMHGQVAAN